MLTPSVSTFADYSDAILSGKRTHVKLTAVGQNIVFEDEDIELSGGLNITSFLNGDVDLTIGRAVMTELVVYLFRNSKVQNIQWSGQFLLEMGVEISGTLASTEWVTVGTFYGKRPERYEQDNVIEFHLCDAVSKLNVPFSDYANTISFTNPVSVSDLYSGICTHCGLQNVAGDELSNIMSRSYDEALPIDDNGLTCRDVIALIAEACGCYARATNDGKIKMVWYTDHMDDYTVIGDNEFDIHVTEVDFVSNNSLKKTWAQLENFTWEDLRYYLWGELEGNEAPFKINALNVRMMQEDSGVLIPSAADRNIYMIVDNHFLETANATEVTNYLTPIYNRLGGFGSYIPMDITCVGNWLIEAGDIITVEVGSNNMVRLPIFTRTFKWNGSPTDTYEATGNLERETITPYVNEKMVSGGRMHVLQQSIDRTYERIQDELGNYSTHEQTAQAISLAVASKVDILYSSYDPADAIAYDSTDTYVVGEFCTESNKLWMCTTAISTAEEFDEDHWKEVKEGTIWVDTSPYLQTEADEYDPTATYSKGELCAQTVSGVTSVYEANTDISTAEAWDSAHWDLYESPVPKNAWHKYNGSTFDSISENTSYEKKSGIDIEDDGVKIYGNKYIHLSADDNKSKWTIDENGLSFHNDISNANEIQFGGQFDAQALRTEAGVYAYKPNGDTTHGRLAFVATDLANRYYSFLIVEYDSQFMYFRPNVNGNLLLGELNHKVGAIYLDDIILATTYYFTHQCFAPQTDLGYYLGTTSRRFSDIYVKNLHADSTGSSSSREKKHDINIIENIGEKIDKLVPVSFVYNNDKLNRTRFGLIYEDVINVIPEICSETKDENSNKTEKELNYIDIVPLLITEIKDLRKRVAELERKVNG